MSTTNFHHSPHELKTALQADALVFVICKLARTFRLSATSVLFVARLLPKLSLESRLQPQLSQRGPFLRCASIPCAVQEPCDQGNAVARDAGSYVPSRNG